MPRISGSAARGNAFPNKRIVALRHTHADVRRHNMSFSVLSNYEPEFIKNAGNGIARIIGARDIEELKEFGDMITRHAARTIHTLIDMEKETGKLSNIRTGSLLPENDPQLFPISRALTYALNDPISYININSALWRFFGIKGLRGLKCLEPGPDWGSFMYYLKDKAGVNVHGIDKNPASVAYAVQGGLDFIAGDASRLPYPDNSFDFVITRSFLEHGHLMVFLDDPYILMVRVIVEIHRVLKPGGLYFSQMEDLEHLDAPFSLFAEYSRLNSSGTIKKDNSTVDILKK